MKQKDIVILYNSGTLSAPEWESTGKTFTGLALTLNANTEDLQYIEEATATTRVVNYKPAYAYTVRPADATPSTIDELIWDAHVRQQDSVQAELMVVYLKKPGIGTAFAAHRGIYNLIPSDGPSGEAGSNVELTGNANQFGDLTHGEATLTGETWAFTKESES